MRPKLRYGKLTILREKQTRKMAAVVVVVQMYDEVNNIVIAVGETDLQSDESPRLHTLTACVCTLSVLLTRQQIMESSLNV